uniref:Uncharacterized protein n=1 Tax=Arundo donax TaxID=35708 RepID=A0A0A9FX63_ARUDO
MQMLLNQLLIHELKTNSDIYNSHSSAVLILTPRPSNGYVVRPNPSKASLPKSTLLWDLKYAGKLFHHQDIQQEAY